MKKKVLFLIHTLGGGGAEKVLVNLVNNLNPDKYDITLMTIIDIGELRYALNPNIKYKTTINLRKNRKENINDKSGSLLNKKSKSKMLFAKMYSLAWRHMPSKIFYKLFIREKYDVEIAFLEGICAKVIAASNNKDSKKYAWIHVDLINQTKSSNVFKNIKKEIETYDKFDKIICVSKVVKEQFIKKYKIAADKVIVKYNAIDKDEIIAKSKEPIADDNLKFDGITFGSIGRLNAQKAYDRLLRIVKKLRSEKYDVNLFIVGEGTAKGDLDIFIIDNKLEKNIKLIGFKSNPYNYIVKADLFVCSSIAEGFSTAVSEAIILGIPVVTTDCSGMKELLGDNSEYGLITENSEESLYMGLKRLLDDDKLMTNYKKAIKKRQSMFDLKKLVSSVEDLLDE